MKSLLYSFLLFFAVVAISAEEECPEKKVICYYSSWSYYRESTGHFNISHIEPNLCTHLVYTFAGLDSNGQIYPLDANYDIAKEGYIYFNSLKYENPCLKTMLAIGGWNEGSMKYSVMASSPESREIFANSVLRFLATYNFDGFDFDWEYPTQRGGISRDRENFVELAKLLKQKFEPWGLELSIAVPISTQLNEAAYDITELIKYIDHVSLMAYDYTPTDSIKTGLIAPLSDIKKTVEYWIKDFPKDRIMLGLPTYARTFVLANNCTDEFDMDTLSPGVPGLYTKEAGFLSYYELLIKLSSNRYKPILKDTNYYACYLNEWMSFDLMDTYQAKVDYVNEIGLGGVMVWTIDTDDFSGKFNDEKITFPILRVLNEKLYN